VFSSKEYVEAKAIIDILKLCRIRTKLQPNGCIWYVSVADSKEEVAKVVCETILYFMGRPISSDLGKCLDSLK